MSMPINTIEAGRFRIPVLLLDNHLLGIVKPQNMPVQRDSSGDLDVLTASKSFVGQTFHKPGAVYMGLVHRLDRPVGGCMILARTSKAAARLSQTFSAHDALKIYLCVLRGHLDQPLTLSDWLLKNEHTGSSCVVPENTPGAKLARLITEPIAHRDGLTLARVTLLTGRSHQIRVQHQHAALPLWGDARYGRGKPGEQIALWAHELTFPHPTTRVPITLTSFPPPSGAFALFAESLNES